MLSIQNLTVAYQQKVILKNLEITFEEGTIHGVLGMNGAGKSTFFNSVVGIKSIKEGACLYHGKWVTSDDIAFMQTSTYFYPYMQGGEYLALLANQNPAFDADHWNKIFQLPLDQLIENYSTGMKKKLAFMGVLAQDRPIMILDEPFNGVDIESNEKIRQILLHLRQAGKCIILSSHITPTLTDCCDQISYLKDGQFTRTYTKENYKDLQQLIKDLVTQDVQEVLGDL
jgi:ABC-2 type transport system ATP-binding protein